MRNFRMRALPILSRPITMLPTATAPIAMAPIAAASSTRPPTAFDPVADTPVASPPTLGWRLTWAEFLLTFEWEIDSLSIASFTVVTRSAWPIGVLAATGDFPQSEVSASGGNSTLRLCVVLELGSNDGEWGD
jgi:hypothetical protein